MKKGEKEHLNNCTLFWSKEIPNLKRLCFCTSSYICTFILKFKDVTISAQTQSSLRFLADFTTWISLTFIYEPLWKFQHIHHFLCCQWTLLVKENCINYRVFHIRTEMPIVAFSSLLCENQKNPVTKCYPRRNRAQALRFQVQHAPWWATEAIACKAKTLRSLYSHALLILTESSKSKNQVVHEQKFKDLPSSNCLSSSSRSMLDLES